MFSLEEILIFSILFIIFSFILKAIFRFIKGVIAILIISFLFPFFLKYIGFQIEINLKNVIFFICLGFGIFVIFYYLKVLWKISKAISNAIAKKAS